MKNKTKYKYSIIIPCYDATEFDFRRCLDSIKTQTIQPYEVICVDDASPTETPKIAIEYGYKYIRHEVNLNNGGARNTGIKEATGDYLIFVNSDDYILPETIEEIDKANNGEDLIIIGFQSFGSSELGYIPNENNTPNLSLLGWYGEPMHIVNRKFLIDNNLFELENVALADKDWTPRLEKAIRTYNYVPKALYMYQVGHESSLLTKMYKRR